MGKILRLVSQVLDQLSRKVIVIFFVVAFIAVIYQVFSRYVLQAYFMKEMFPSVDFSVLIFPWTEELVRYLFVWIVFLGIGVVYKLKGHFTVEIVTNFLPNKFKHTLALVVEIINSLFFLILLLKSFQLLSITNGQLSPSLQLNMAYMYISILVCSFICLIHSLVFIVDGLKNFLVKENQREVIVGFENKMEFENKAEVFH